MYKWILAKFWQKLTKYGAGIGPCDGLAAYSVKSEMTRRLREPGRKGRRNRTRTKCELGEKGVEIRQEQSVNWEKRA